MITFPHMHPRNDADMFSSNRSTCSALCADQLVVVLGGSVIIVPLRATAQDMSLLPAAALQTLLAQLIFQPDEQVGVAIDIPVQSCDRQPLNTASAHTCLLWFSHRE